MLSQRVLPLRALGVFEYLTQSRLPDVEISIPFQVAGLHLLMSIVHHRRASPRFCRSRPARINTISDRISGGTILAFVFLSSGSMVATITVVEPQTSSHSRIPWRRNRTS